LGNTQYNTISSFLLALYKSKKIITRIIMGQVSIILEVF
jgi:hypothetical protein